MRIPYSPVRLERVLRCPTKGDERLPPKLSSKFKVTSVRMIAGPRIDVSSSRATFERCRMKWTQD